MNNLIIRIESFLRCKTKGMELVQVAILIAIAIALGLIFKEKIGAFVSKVFEKLSADDFLK